MWRDETPDAAAGRPDGVRVFVCDDAPWMCELIGYWLGGHGDLDLVGQGHSREQALAGIAATRPDVVILDTLTHDDDRVSVADVRHLVPAVGIVVYSGYPPDVAGTLLPGADDYLSKDEGEDALVEAIRRAAALAGPGSDDAPSG